MATTLDQALNPDIFGMQPRLPSRPAPQQPMDQEALAQRGEQELAGVTKQREAAEAQRQQAEAGMQQIESQKAQALATGRREAQEKYTQQMKEAPMAKPLEEAQAQEQNFYFRPSQKDGMELATLASLMTVLGTSLGKGGKSMATAALAGLNGMMDGYRKGSENVYKQEKAAFETNSKALLNNIATLRKALEDYQRNAVQDRQTALLKLEEEFSKTGADMMKYRQQREGATKLISELTKQENELRKRIDGHMSKAADARSAAERIKEQERARKEAEEQRAKDREFQIRLAASLRPTKEPAPGLKPSAKIQEGYIANNILIQDLDNMASKLKNPKIVEGLKKYRMEAFLTEEGKLLNQVLEKEIPSDLRKFLTEVRDVRNNYYLNMSGKAVTGGEALRNYGTVPQPGDSPEVMEDKIVGMRNRVQQVTDVQKNLYGLPDLNKVKLQGMKPAINPGEAYPTTVDQTAAPSTGGALSPAEQQELEALRSKHGRRPQ